jgi:hypothetical protein
MATDRYAKLPEVDKPLSRQERTKKRLDTENGKEEQEQQQEQEVEKVEEVEDVGEAPSE